MGKQRITELLARLKDNEARELDNAASIYTVAQVAVNALDQPQQLASDPSSAALLPAPIRVSKAELLERYGSYNGCRKTAKALGIRFNKTPSWEKLEAAFSYQEACQQWVQQYLQLYPSQQLSGITIEVQLD